MDIGSEISRKIQLAIKAKLIEINAYVDDELPDYIMIMIANRKPEEQMSEALSLFLGEHTKVFTVWLYELLSTLRGKRTQKETVKDSNEEEAEENTEVAQPISSAAETKVTVETPDQPSTGITEESKDVAKPSRWDIKQQNKKDKEKHLYIDNEKAVLPVNEAVIDILPEVDDLFDNELLADNENIIDVKSIKSTEKLVESSKSGAKTENAQTKPRDLNKDRSQVPSEDNRKSHSKVKTDKKSTEKKRKSNDAPTKEHVSSSRSSPPKTKTKELDQKRHISVKMSKHSSRKLSTTDKEFSQQFAPLKVKRKKLKRSSEKESSSSHKRKSTKSSHVREWDKDKGRQELSYHDSRPSKSYQSDNEDDIVPQRRISSTISSSVSSVIKDSRYSSEESDDDTAPSATVISKVAIPERRSRLPPTKQANRSLLLKAVSEAESSIRKHRLSQTKISDALSDKLLMSHQQSSTQDEERTLYQQKDEQSKKSSRLLNRNDNSSAVQQSNKIKVINKKRKSTGNENPQTSRTTLDLNDDSVCEEVRQVKVAKKSEKKHDDEPQHSASNSFQDSRLIVTREKVEEKTTLTRKKNLIRRPVDAGKKAAVQFDSRKLSAKTNKKHSDNDDATKDRITAGQKHPAGAADESKNIKKNKKDRSPSPCFIVTLDGPSSTNSQTSQNKVSSTSSKVPFRAIPVQAPDSGRLSTAQPVRSSDMEPNKQNMEAGDADNSSNDLELSSMRQKLLKMQEEAIKLKKIQIKQQALIQQKVAAVMSIGDKPDTRSIHIANVHFSATEKQITEHFSICGKVIRVTVLKDPFTGHPKGFAYLEFEENNSIDMALALDGTNFCGRDIKVTKKENEAPKMPSSYPTATRYFTPRSYRFPSRAYKRYNPNKLFSRPRIRAILPRNKSWVKPGYMPS